MTIQNINKTVLIGSVKTWERGRWARVFCKIEFKDGRLSIHGVVGPLRSGNALGSCGQIIDHVANIERLADGWTPAKLGKFIEVWHRWHLNDMRAGCEHQRDDGWGKESITLITPQFHTWRLVGQNSHAKPFCAKLYAKVAEAALYGEIYEPKTPAEKSWFDSKVIEIKTETKSSSLVRPQKHPKGVLTKACPICGYKYGTSRLKEEVPQDVLKFLASLPDSPKQPAWV